MTYQDEAVEVRRTSVGTKVLIFACAILAVLGSFWSIVWFIRAYVEAPRVGIPPALALAARDTAPVVPPAPTVAPAPMNGAAAQPASVLPAPPAATAEAAADKAPAPKAAREAEPSVSLSDRWLPATPAPQAEQPASAQAAPAAEIAAAPEAEPPVDDVAESSVPAISGPAPLPAASRPRPRWPSGPIRRCRVRAPTGPHRRACSRPCRSATTASRRSSHSIAPPAAIACGP